MTRGALVVFEGAEGVGKTTQVRRVAEWIASVGVPCVALREPGGTSLGERVREVLLDAASDPVPEAEALLFMACRAQIVATRVKPALESGAIVLLDRFFLSTYAYQVAGRGLEESRVREANALATDGLVPDLTVLLELPVEEGMARADQRGARDRMEQAGDAFHARVARAFDGFASDAWQIAHPEAGTIVRVSASGTADDVFARLQNTLVRVVPSLRHVANVVGAS